MLRKPLLPGKSEIEQLDLIFKLLGSPSEEKWPGYQQLPNAQGVKWKSNPKNKLRDKFPMNSSFTGGPALTNQGYDLLSRLLSMDPAQRISAEDALQHEYFREKPVRKHEDLMPTFPATNASNHADAHSAQVQGNGDWRAQVFAGNEKEVASPKKATSRWRPCC